MAGSATGEGDDAGSEVSDGGHRRQWEGRRTCRVNKSMCVRPWLMIYISDKFLLNNNIDYNNLLFYILYSIDFKNEF